MMKFVIKTYWQANRKKIDLGDFGLSKREMILVVSNGENLEFENIMFFKESSDWKTDFDKFIQLSHNTGINFLTLEVWDNQTDKLLKSQKMKQKTE